MVVPQNPKPDPKSKDSDKNEAMPPKRHLLLRSPQNIAPSSYDNISWHLIEMWRVSYVMYNNMENICKKNFYEMSACSTYDYNTSM